MKIKAVLFSIVLAFSVFCPVVGLEGREALSTLALFMALAIALWGLYRGDIKPLKNKSLLLFVFFLLFSAWQAPKGIIVENGLVLANYWVWKSMFTILLFLGMYWTISGTVISNKNKRIILNTMVWCGFLIALHCIFQNWGYMQWFKIGTHHEALVTPQAGVVGMLGHPTMVGPFIGMLIPVAFYLRKWFFAIPMIIAVCLTHSWVAIGAIAASLLLLLFLLSPRWAKIAMGSLLISIIACLLIFTGANKVGTFIESKSSGRIAEWSNVIKAVKEPFGENDKCYSYTGFGPGSFQFIYLKMFPQSNFSYAHNEYLEVLFNYGIIGLILFLTAIVLFIMTIDFKLWINLFLFSGVTCMFFAAAGNFIFQISPQNIFLITLLGLIKNKGDNNVCCKPS